MGNAEYMGHKHKLFVYNHAASLQVFQVQVVEAQVFVVEAPPQVAPSPLQLRLVLAVPDQRLRPGLRRLRSRLRPGLRWLQRRLQQRLQRRCLRWLPAVPAGWWLRAAAAGCRAAAAAGGQRRLPERWQRWQRLPGAAVWRQLWRQLRWPDLWRPAVWRQLRPVVRRSRFWWPRLRWPRLRRPGWLLLSDSSPSGRIVLGGSSEIIACCNPWDNIHTTALPLMLLLL